MFYIKIFIKITFPSHFISLLLLTFSDLHLWCTKHYSNLLFSMSNNWVEIQCPIIEMTRVVIGSVQSVFFIWPTKTEISGLQSSQPKSTEIVETQSISDCFGFGRFFGWCSVFVPWVWASWAFGFFFQKFSVWASFFFFSFFLKMQYSSQLFYSPFMLFVIKPFLETYFRPFLGTSCGPDLGLLYFCQWSSLSLF